MPTITLTAEPQTHNWRKPPDFEFDSAPRHLLPPQPFSSFSRARVTASADWRGRRDNVGLMIRFTNPAHPSQLPRYVRVGPEVVKEHNHDELHISVVSTVNSSDWSLHQRDVEDESGHEVTVEVRVERDPVGSSFFVYYLSMDSEGGVKSRHSLRELSWMFEEDNWQVEVGVYAATPAGDRDSRLPRKTLVARFKKLIVE